MFLGNTVWTCDILIHIVAQQQIIHAFSKAYQAPLPAFFLTKTQILFEGYFKRSSSWHYKGDAIWQPTINSWMLDHKSSPTSCPFLQFESAKKTPNIPCMHMKYTHLLVNGPQHATKLLTQRVFVPLLSLLLCHNVVLTALSLWQGGVGVASESCLHHNQWQCSEPVEWRGRELDGEQRPGGVHQVSAACSHASLDKAQHPPLQGKTGLSHLERHLLCYYC